MTGGRAFRIPQDYVQTHDQIPLQRAQLGL